MWLQYSVSPTLTEAEAEAEMKSCIVVASHFYLLVCFLFLLARCFVLYSAVLRPFFSHTCTLHLCKKDESLWQAANHRVRMHRVSVEGPLLARIWWEP